MTAYYNDNNPYVAQWLKNLVSKGLIAKGDVDDRSITDVRASELVGYRQCHFFAGIGGWSYALRLARWPDNRAVWTASCPCPPWSRARVWHRHYLGKNDDRDLWPAFFKLVKIRQPAVVIGEQVAGIKVQPWVDRLRRNMEGQDYNVEVEKKRSRDCGGPQVRTRLFFSADLGRKGKSGSIKGRSARKTRPWRWRGEEDLRAIAKAPLQQGRCWPQPIVRRGDDGLPFHMAQLRAYGNSIDPWVAAQFIGETFGGHS